MVKKNIRSILNGLGTSVIIVNIKGDVLFANAAAKAQLNKGKRESFPALKTKTCRAMLSQIRLGRDSETDHMVIQETVPTAFRVTAVKLEPDNSNEKIRAAFSFEDISHMHEAEQMRSDFVANVSHELRSPLTTLNGFIETLQGPAKTDAVAQTRFLGLMETEAKRMARLIDDLLSLAKLESLERREFTDLVQVDLVLQQVVEMLTPNAVSQGKEIILKLESDLRQVAGQADQMTQLFVNLIENALKYGRAGTPVVIEAARSKKKNRIKVCVCNQGDGIPDDAIPRLTERFYRVDKGRSRNMGGTGLGLAIVKHILIRHKGWLEIESTLGEGSAFTVYLPESSKG